MNTLVNCQFGYSCYDRDGQQLFESLLMENTSYQIFITSTIDENHDINS